MASLEGDDISAVDGEQRDQVSGSNDLSQPSVNSTESTKVVDIGDHISAESEKKTDTSPSDNQHTSIEVNNDKIESAASIVNNNSEVETSEQQVPDELDLALATVQEPNVQVEEASRSSTSESSISDANSDSDSDSASGSGSDSDSDSSSGSSSEDDDDDDGTKSVEDEVVTNIDEDDEQGDTGPLKTKNEIEDQAPTLPEDFKISENATIEYLGTLFQVTGTTAIIKAANSGEYRVLNESSVLCFEDKTPLGLLYETFGRVQEPFHSVVLRDNSVVEEVSSRKGAKVFYVVSDSTFLLTQTVKGIKGSDASNLYDEEIPPEEQEFSDDEKERESKSKKRKNKKPTNKDNNKRKPNHSNNNSNNNNNKGRRDQTFHNRNHNRQQFQNNNQVPGNFFPPPAGFMPPAFMPPGMMPQFYPQHPGMPGLFNTPGNPGFNPMNPFPMMTPQFYPNQPVPGNWQHQQQEYNPAFPQTGRSNNGQNQQPQQGQRPPNARDTLSYEENPSSS